MKLWRIERRMSQSRWTAIGVRVSAVILAILLSGITIQLSGFSAISLDKKALISTLTTPFGLQQAFILTTPLILTGLACALCLRMNLWNIGAEGHLYMGAWAATAIGIHVEGPPLLVFIAIFTAAALTGALWMLVPALARAYLKVNEIITTLLLNFVAMLWVNIFAMGYWRDALVIRSTVRVPYELPEIWGSMHIGIFISFLFAVISSLLVRNTKLGYEMRVIGHNEKAAHFAGMNVARNIIIVMLFCGALAGISGAIEVTGSTHRLNSVISNQYGYSGIIVAVLAGASPAALIPVAFLYAILLNAGIVLQTQGLSVNTVIAITGFILLLASIGEVAAKYRIVRADQATPIPQNSHIYNGIEPEPRTAGDDASKLIDGRTQDNIEKPDLKD
jgi:ABC-type uncharacterized transport system permease subunit